MEIRDQLVPKTAKGRRPGIKRTVKGITIHSNANINSTAQNEADNICNNSPEMQVSFHIVVDDKQAIRCIPDLEVAWHAGDDLGTGNMTTIGVEICEGGNRILAFQNAVEVVKKLMAYYKLDQNAVVQHNAWTGKNCPRILRDPAYIKKPFDWAYFKSQLEPAPHHWAQPYLDSLVAKKIIMSPLAHSDLDKPITKGEMFAMIDRITPKI